jgi:3-hydroxyisobutyrate dehydrogenase
VSEPRRIGFVGIGRMGWPMAANLARAGYQLTVADADPDRARAFAAEHGGGMAAPGQAGAGADALITMLPSSREVTEVLRAEAPGLAPGRLVLEMSSGEPAVTRALAAELAGRDVTLVDAPVSGGVKRAVTGELTMMYGGDEDTLQRCDPVLRAMGSTVLRCGDVGAGQAMKALNNLVSAGGLLLTVEALLIGQSAGLDPQVMTDVLNVSTGMTNSSKVKISQFVLSRSFDSGFGLDLMVKDLGIALDVGRDASLATPLAALCAQLWQGAQSVLGPGQDHTSIAEFSERLAGRRLTEDNPPDGDPACTT